MNQKEFPQAELDAAVRATQKFMADEFELDLGRFEAERVIAFFTREIGNRYYNRGLHAAEAAFMKKMDEAADALVQLERHS